MTGQSKPSAAHEHAESQEVKPRHRLIAGVALVDQGHCDGIAHRLLDLCGQRTDMRPALLVARCDQDRQQLPGVDCWVHLRAPTTLVPIIT